MSKVNRGPRHKPAKRLWWGEAEAEVAFIAQSAIRCEPLAEREAAWIFGIFVLSNFCEQRLAGYQRPATERKAIQAGSMLASDTGWIGLRSRPHQRTRLRIFDLINPNVGKFSKIDNLDI